MYSGVRILLTFATVAQVLGHGLAGPCRKIDVGGVATIDIEDSILTLQWKNGRPDGSGQMNLGERSYSGYVDFPDDRRYSFNFYPEEETIYWDGDKGTTTHTWRYAKSECAPCRKIEVNGIATIDIEDSVVTLHWKNGRPDANGEMNLGDKGYVNFPDDRRYSFNFYRDEETIYWDGDKGNTNNIWKNARCEAPCKKIDVGGVVTIDIEDSILTLQWKNGRPDASGQMNLGERSYSGYVDFPDDRRYSFNFYPEEETIYWDGDKGTTTHTWRYAKSGCVVPQRLPCTSFASTFASININDDTTLTLRWKSSRRPNAKGVIDRGVNPHTGYVNFPDDRLYTFNFYPNEETIYWDGDKGGTNNIWRNVRCEA